MILIIKIQIINGKDTGINYIMKTREKKNLTFKIIFDLLKIKLEEEAKGFHKKVEVKI